MDRVHRLRKSPTDTTKRHYVAYKTRILSIVLVVPMALLLVLLLIAGIVGSPNSRVAAALVGLPFIVAIVALLIRFAYAFTVSTDEHLLIYRTALRTRRFRREDIKDVSVAEVSNGFRTFSVPALTLRTGKTLNLRPFNCYRPKAGTRPNPKALDVLNEMASDLDEWARGPAMSPKPASVGL
jgi:hypothetical protein